MRSLGSQRIGRTRINTSNSGLLHRGRGCSAMQSRASVGAPKTVRGISEVLADFDGVLLDQFGVLHDGKTPYTRSIDAVRQLAAAKQVVIVSNSSRRSGGTIGKLVKMGFEAEWFAGAITSGELTHRYLADRPDPWWRQLGRRCLHLTWSSRGTISLEGLGLEVVSSPDDSPDFILAHGTEAVAAPSSSPPSAAAAAAPRDASLEQLRELLEHCAAVARARGRPMPMIVANPGACFGSGGLFHHVAVGWGRPTPAPLLDLQSRKHPQHPKQRSLNAPNAPDLG